MATKNDIGAAARLNSPQQLPPKVKVDHDDAEFGYSWFAALNPDQRGACIDWWSASMGAAADTAHLPVTVVNRQTGRAAAAFMLTTDAQKFVEFMAQRTGRADQYVLADLPENLGSGSASRAADRLEALATQPVVDAPATGSNDAPASTPDDEWTPAAERVSLAREALFQAVQVADLLIGELKRDRNDETPLYLGLTVRVRELADAADLLLTCPDCCDEEDAISQASRVMFGPGYRSRATEGVAL